MKNFFSRVRNAGWGLMLVLGLGGAERAAGQTAPIRTYTFAASTAPYTTIVANAIARDIMQDDNDSRPLPIGFAFPYGGATYTQFVASSEGWLKLGNIGGVNPPNDLTGVGDLLAPFWDDMSGNMGTAWYGVTGTAPNRVFAMEWQRWRWPYNAYENVVGAPPTVTLSFQVKLYETSGVIQYCYQQLPGVPYPATNLGATIGIGSYSSFLSLSNASAAPTASSTVSTNTIAQRPATGQVYTFTPPPPCPSPTGVVATATSATTASVAFVSGAGNATYTVTYGLAGTATTNTATAATNPVLLTGLLPNSTYTVSLGNTCTSGASSPFAGQVYVTTPPVPNTAATWTGAAGTAWEVAGNWNPAAVPIGTVDVLIPPVANQPTVRGAATCGMLTLQAGARLTLATASGTGPATALRTTGTVRLPAGSTLVQAASTTLDVGRDLTNNGATLTLDPSSVVAFGDDLHTLNGTATTTLQNVYLSTQFVYNELHLAAPLRVQRLLTMVQNSTLEIEPGGALRLLSNAQGTAQIVRDPDCFIIGQPTVESWLLAGTPNTYAGVAVRYHASPVRTATPAALAAPGFAPVLNPAYNTSPTPASTVPFPTVFAYDQSRISTNANGLEDFETGFYSPTALTDPLGVGVGYRLLAPGTTTLAVTGLLTTNAVTRTGFTRATLPQSGYHLLGNPFASTLDWDSVRLARGTNGFDAANYVYRPTGPAAGTFAAYVNGIGAGRYLLPGQAFFVRVSAASTPANISFPHGSRYRAYYDPAVPPAAALDARPLVQLTLAGATGPVDEATAYFQTGATAGFDRLFDAHKLPTGGVPYVAFAGPAPLAISGLPPLTAADVVLPLDVRVPATGAYTLSGAQLRNLPAGTYAYLQDAQTGRAVDLNVQPGYAFTMNAAFAGPRFTLLLTRTVLATAPAALSQQVLLYPNPAHGVAQLELPAALHRQAVTAVVVDAVGQVVRTLMLPAGPGLRALALAGLAPGAYTVQLRTPQGTVAKRLLLE